MVPVPNGATTGNILVTVAGVASNGANFTVTTAGPPKITAAASPAPNSNGWNNSSVTVTFTCTAGSATITNCPAPQTISSQGPNQIVTGTATDANGLSATTSITLNIDKTQPVLAVSSPADGTGFSTAAVTVSGTASDALSGVSSVTCDGVAANVTGGNFSCNISLTVGVNLVVVRATDVSGNVAASNFHLTLVGTLPAPNTLQISPSGVNMLAGETRQFAAVDELGRVRSDATWAVSDSTLATITADSSPTLTAVAIGQVTLTATVQSITAQVQLHILSGATLPPGAVRWSAPPVPGFTTRQIIQAVPTAGNGPDLYSHEIDSNGNGLIRAFTADGLPMWQASLGPVDFSGATPDGLGGVLVSNTTYDGSFYPPHITTTLTDLDAVTGSPVWTYSPVASFSQRAIRADGTIFLVQAPPEDSAGNVYTYLVALDGNSGAALSSFLLPNALTQVFDNCHGNLYLSYYASLGASNLAIDTDGTVNLAISSRSGTSAFNCDASYTSSYTTAVSLFQLRTDGSTSAAPIRTTTLDTSQPGTTVPIYDPWQVIPDGQGGTLVAWVDRGTASQPLDYVTHISASGNSDFFFPSLSGPLPSMVLGENGTAFVTDAQTIQAFNVSSGPLWNYVSPALGVEIIASSAGGGLVAGEFPASRGETVLRFDSTGQPTYDGTGNATPAPAFGSLFQASWTGEMLGLSTSSSSPALSLATFTTPVVDWAHSSWAAPGGSPAADDRSVEMPQFAPLPSCPGAPTPCANEAIYAALASLVSVLGQNCPLCQANVFDKVSTTTNQFVIYLQSPKPKFYDGTKSQATRCGALYKCGWWGWLTDGWTVAHFFEVSGNDTTAATLSPSSPLQTFFRPSTISLANGGINLFNMSVIFHEGLHGKTGLTDSDLQKALGCKQQDDTRNITWYMEQFVSSTAPQQVQACRNYPGHL